MAERKKKAVATRRLEFDQEPIWDVQFDETIKQFLAFSFYRDMLDGRSLARVAAKWNKDPDAEPGTKGNPMSRLQLWSAQNRWVERAEAYDVFLLRRLQEERETEISRMNRMEISMGRAAMSLALKRIIGAPREGDNAEVEPLDPNKMTAGEVAMLGRFGVDVTRLATGRPTQLIKGAFLITAAEASQMTGDLVEMLMRHIPDERKAMAAQEVQAYASGERRMIGR